MSFFTQQTAQAFIQYSPKDVHQLMQSNAVQLIDVRELDEYKDGHITGCVHIPMTTLISNPALLEKYAGKKIIVYCHAGRRSANVCQKIKEHNQSIDIHNLDGGIVAWQYVGLSVQK